MHQHTAEDQESVGDRAARLLRETADALDACPIRRHSFLGQTLVVNPDTLREEADYIESILAMARRAMTIANRIEGEPHGST